MKIYFKQSSSNFAAEFGLLLLLECNFWEGYCASALGRWRNFIFVGFPGGASCKEPPASTGDISHGFNPWVWTVPRRRATHPSILAWSIPWTEKPGGLECMGSQGVGHDWSGLALSMHMRTQTKSPCRSQTRWNTMSLPTAESTTERQERHRHHQEVNGQLYTIIPGQVAPKKHHALPNKVRIFEKCSPKQQNIPPKKNTKGKTDLGKKKIERNPRWRSKEGSFIP